MMSEPSDKESKTEEPTQKRIADALAEGKLPLAREMPVLLHIAAIWLALVFLLGYSAVLTSVALRQLWRPSGDWRLESAGDLVRIVVDLLMHAGVSVAPLLATLSVGGLVGSIPQSRGAVWKRLKPDITRISPVSGFKRLFGASGLRYAAAALLKLFLVGVGALVILAVHLSEMQGLYLIEPSAAMKVILHISAQLAAAVCLCYMLIAATDAISTYVAWRRDLRMTTQEVKDELKEAEGNPQIKSKLRHLARQRLRKRMMAAVPRATVVIANPTHYAIALSYVRGKDGAPRVVAKGIDHLALRIRTIAQESNVPIIEDRALARALYEGVALDSMIPEQFYMAVAKIIRLLERHGRV